MPPDSTSMSETGARQPGNPEPGSCPRSRRPLVAVIAVAVVVGMLAVILRGWALDGSGLQNDEQIWHERPARFVESVLGPFAPAANLRLPKTFWPVKHVDLRDHRLALATEWPFSIVMPAHHPGVPISLAIGLSYLFLAEGSSNWSLNVGSAIEVMRYPNVLVGTLLCVVIFLGGRRIVGDRAALIAAVLAGVEPLLVGYSRLARLDLSVAFWTTLAVFAFLEARRRDRRIWAAASGACVGLAFATNPYGLFILPTLLAARMLYPGAGESVPARVRAHGFRVWRWPDRLDWTLAIAVPIAFIIAYPNLWPNPVVGLHRMLDVLGMLPHVTGQIPPRMPLSPMFYLSRMPEHVLPWTLALAGLGAVAGIAVRDRAAVLLLVWIASFLALLSIPPGYKEVKNALSVLPPLLLLAGLGLAAAAAWLERRLGARPARLVFAAGLVGLIAAGLHATWSWWPYPKNYTWPWRPDPQTLEVRELIGEGEGIKEAIAYIRAQGPPDARLGMFTGRNNAEYYYPADLLGDPVRPEHLADYDWLLVLPKLTFSGSDSHPLVAWLRSREPTHIVRQHQIELVRLYRLDGRAGR